MVTFTPTRDRVESQRVHKPKSESIALGHSGYTIMPLCTQTIAFKVQYDIFVLHTVRIVK